jgi:hypothetical protein
MLKLKSKTWLFLAIGLANFALVGCNTTPDEKQLDEWKNLEGPGEMKPGAGLFSGKEGEFVIYDSKKGGAFPQNKKAEPTAEAAGAATVMGSQTTAQPAATAPDPQDFQEFQEFQQWQKEKKQFHEYQEWKKTAKGSADFKEFQDYQQWQNSAKGSADFKDFQEYQQWQKTGKGSADYKEFLEWREFKKYQEWKNS